MTFLALIAIIFFGFAVYNLTCAFVDIPTKKTSQMMMLSRKQQGTKNEKLLDVYVTKIAGWIAPYLRLDRRLNEKTGIPFHIAEDPLRAIARGTGIALKNINRFSFLMK